MYEPDGEDVARRPAKARPLPIRTHLEPLPGWWLVDDASDFLGISRQAVHRLINRGTIKKARYVGMNSARRPVIVVWAEEIRALPMSPQRKREFRLRGELPESADLGDELPGT